MRGKLAIAGVVAGLSVGGGGLAGATPSGPHRADATLALRAELRTTSALVDCPSGVTVSACAARAGSGVVPGLGRVTTAYTFLAHVGPPSCPEANGKTFGYSVRLVVAGKGELLLTLAEARDCVTQELVRAQTQAFTITGGTGSYAGATGSGTVERAEVGETPSGARVFRETWAGTLDVPNLQFDLVPPTLSGATAKTVRAPRGATRARVTYAVTARDDVDGAVTPTCVPRSGTRFRVGRTVVTCTATDSSGNSSTARFRVTVTRRR